MALYNLYAGLGERFGGAKLFATEEFASEAEATFAAYTEAVNIYKQNENKKFLLSKEDCEKELQELFNCIDDIAVAEKYQAEIDKWIEFYVEEAKTEQCL